MKVTIYDAKAKLSKLVSTVERTGERITITRNGVSVADLVPHHRVVDPLVQDPGLVGAVYRVDPCAPVSEADWPASAR